MSQNSIKTEFVKALRGLGFTPVPGLADSWQHNEKGYYAEIREHTKLWVNVWLVGPGLKGTGFPGGWVYESPQEIEKEVTKHTN